MTDAPAESASQASGRSWLRILLIVVVVLGLLVGLYAWAGFKLAPRLITRNASQYVREHYGRELVLRDVQFNPFTLELRIGEMVLPDKDGGPMLSWQQLLVDIAGWRSLTRRAFAFEHIQLSKPRIDVVHRADGNWNLLDLIPPAADPAPAKAEKPPRLIVDAFDLVQGAGSFTDHLQGEGETEQVTDLNFSLRDFSTLVSGNHFDLRAASPNIESIHLEGNFSVEPLASSGRVEIGGLSLPRIQKTWLRDSRPVVENGTLEFAGDYQLDVPQGPLEFKAQVGTLRATDLALLADGATESWVRVPVLTVSDTALDLAAQHVKVGEVVIDQPAVTAVLDAEANLNLLAYVPAEEAPAAGQPPSGSGAPSQPWNVEIGSVAMNGAAVDFTSHVEVVEPMHWRIAPLEVSTGAIVLPAKAPVELRATGSIEPSGKFSLAGTHDLESGISKLDLDASGLDLPVLQPVFDQQTQVSIRKGQASAKGQLVIGGPASVTFAGTAIVDNLRVADRLNDTDLVRWRRMTATGVDLQLEPLKASVRDLLLQQPYAQLVIEPNGTTNIGVALSPPGTMPPADQPLPEGGDEEPDVKQEARAAGIAPPPAAAETAPAAPGEAAPQGEALPFDIGKVRIVDGSMNFTDRTLAPQFSTGILAMNGTITGLSGRPGSVAEVTIDGSVDRYAPVTIRGNVNYFAATTLTDLHMNFSNLEMTTFSPYSGKFAGYRIEKGKLNLETDYRIVNAQLDARHHIVIDQLQLGDRVESREAVSLPLKLAVALLKDSNGVIDLDIPVTGSLDDPKFRIGPIVWKMVKNLLVKVATSPFKFIGSLFGGDGEEMQYIDFAPGRSALDENDLKKLEALRKALVDRPGLSLDIPMALDPALDTPALADAHWQSMLDTAAKERFGDKAQQPGFIDSLATKPKDRRKLMVTAYRTQFGKDPQWPKPDSKDPAQKDRDPDELAAEWVEQQLRPAVQVGNDGLQALGKARADAIQDALLKDGGIDPARVFVIIQKDIPEAPPAPAPDAAPAAGGQVRAQLSLK